MIRMENFHPKEKLIILLKLLIINFLKKTSKSADKNDFIETLKIEA